MSWKTLLSLGLLLLAARSYAVAGKAPDTTAPPAPAAPAAPAAEEASEPPTVAVLDYEVTAPQTTEMGSQVADLLTVRLSLDDSIHLVERAQLGKVLAEQKLKLQGLTSQDQAVEVGKLLGARLMVLGKMFMMDRQLMVVTRVVGVETGRVKGTLRAVEPSKPLSEAVMLVAEDVAAVIQKNAAALLPPDVRLYDPIAPILKALGNRPRPALAVVIPEVHRTRVVVDPAVETEIKRTLLACGFRLVDTGNNDLADWAKQMVKGEKPAWPGALADADLVVVGEAFSEFALRTGDLLTCTGRAEVNLISRHSGEILLADRQTDRAVDLAETTAGKTALQKAGRQLGLAICRRLVTYKGPIKKPVAAPTTKPAGAPAKRPAGTGPQARAAPSLAVRNAIASTASTTRVLLLAAEAPGAAQPPAEAKKDAAKHRTLFAALFENETGQEQYDPVAAGLGDLAAVLLAEQEHITVVERQRLLALAEEQARSLKGLTGEKHALAAGKLLKADTVLTGRLYLVEGKLTVSLKAVDIASERVLAADQASFRPSDLAETALQLARRLGEQMALPLPEIDLKAVDASPIASLHFAKALGCYYAGNLDEAIMQFMRTADLDPDYTEAHFWQGMCHQRLGEHAHAVIEWEKYLARHPDSDRSDAVRKLLDEAKRQDAAGSPERLGPKTPAGPPAPDGPKGVGPAAPAEKPQPPQPAKDPAEAARIRAHSALQLGKALEKAGKPEAARREYERVVKEYPDTEEAKEARRRLEALGAAAKPPRD